MKKSRILALALSVVLVMALFPMTAFAGASLSIVASFDPDTLSGPGGVTYKYKVSNTGSAKVTDIQITADGTIVGTIASLGSGEAVSDHGYVEMGEGDIGRNIRFVAKGYAKTGSGGGLAGMTSNTGSSAASGGGTAVVSAVCDTEIARGSAVPVIGGGTQPVPVIGGGTQPVPVVNKGVTKVKASATVNSKVINVDDSCTVTVTARNSGTNDVSDVKILIDQIVYARSGYLAAGQTGTYRFELPIHGPLTFQPVICYTGSDGVETAQGLEKFSITCPTNDLSLTVQASTTNPGPYEDVVFHIELSNNGNDVIQNLQLYDCDHQPIGGPLGALYPRQVVTADLEAGIHLATNIVFYVDAVEGGGRVSAQSNMIRIIPSIQ